MVLGLPGDVGISGDWNGDGLDSPGVFRGNLFLLSDQMCICSVYADYAFRLGNPNDVPFTGDWLGHSSVGVGTFRSTNGLTFTRNELTTGYADSVYVYGIGGDVPVAGHWKPVSASQPQADTTAPKTPSRPNVIVAATLTPLAGGNGLSN